MTQRFSRRDVLKAAGALSAAVTLQYPAPFVSAAVGSNEKLNVALIGCGERGRFAHLPYLIGENLVAVADADETRSYFALRDIRDKVDISRIQSFYDYRQLFDKIEKQIDAVFIATPDHQHANPSLRAIKAGKHVYTEKCLTHDISEARILGDAARQSKVVTQMGNQGSGTGNHQVLAEYLKAGAIGRVKEVHAWCGWRPMRFGCQMDYPEGDLGEMPETHWSEWLGQAKERMYSDYFRCEWYSWFDFATGSLGGWGTHILDAVFFALKLKYPTSVELVEASQLNADRFPRHATIKFEFSSESDAVQPLPVYWYDGSVPNPKNPHRSIPHYPPLYHEIRKKYGEAGKALGNAGSIFVGDKGMIFCCSHGGAPQLFPLELRQEFKPPTPTLPRPCGDIFRDFFRACKEGGHPAFSNFADFSGPFVEGLLAGHLAVHAGLHERVEWDGEKMQSPNRPELARWIKQERRKGWELV